MTYQPKDFGQNLTAGEQGLLKEIQQQGTAQAAERAVETAATVAPTPSNPQLAAESSLSATAPPAPTPTAIPTEAVRPAPTKADPEPDHTGQLLADKLYAAAAAGNLSEIEANISPLATTTT